MKQQIPLQCRLASFAPATLDTEKRTVELVWSTGAVVRRYSWMRDEVFNEELSMDAQHVRMSRLNTGAPLLDNHGGYTVRNVLGVVERAWLDGKEGRAEVRFSKRSEIDPILSDVRDGIIRNVSVGYQVFKFKESTKEGDRHRTLTAVDWEPTEISLVPVGADANAGVRSEMSMYECEIEDLAERGAATTGKAERGIPLDILLAINDSRKRSLKGAF